MAKKTIPTSLSIKLASIIVHYEELNSPSGNPADQAAIDGLRGDPEVKAFMDAPENQIFFPRKLGLK